MTGSQSAELIELRLRFLQCRLDVEVDLDHPEPVLQHAVRLDQPELALACLELELHLAHERGARPVEYARRRTEDALDCGDELGGGILEPYASLPGTGSKPIASSSA